MGRKPRNTTTALLRVGSVFLRFSDPFVVLWSRSEYVTYILGAQRWRPETPKCSCSCVSDLDPLWVLLSLSGLFLALGSWSGYMIYRRVGNPGSGLFYLLDQRWAGNPGFGSVLDSCIWIWIVFSFWILWTDPHKWYMFGSELGRKTRIRIRWESLYPNPGILSCWIRIRKLN